MRKQNLKIQMLAGNNLKSCPDTRSKKTVTLVTCVGLICVNRITIQGVQNGGGGLERFVEPKGRTSNLLEPPIFFQNRTSNSSNLPKKVEPQAVNLVRPNTSRK